MSMQDPSIDCLELFGGCLGGVASVRLLQTQPCTYTSHHLTLVLTVFITCYVTTIGSAELFCGLFVAFVASYCSSLCGLPYKGQGSTVTMQYKSISFLQLNPRD